eukprot:353391-Chlamydomonas_euryale.AAC.4
MHSVHTRPSPHPIHTSTRLASRRVHTCQVSGQSLSASQSPARSLPHPAPTPRTYNTHDTTSDGLAHDHLYMMRHT